MKLTKRTVTTEIIEAIHCLHDAGKTYKEIAAVIGFSTWVVGEVLRCNVHTETEWKNRYIDLPEEEQTEEQIVIQMDNPTDEVPADSVVEALNKIGKVLENILTRLDDTIYVKKAYD